MATVLKFVDSIAASPTTRLDLNDGTTWKMRDFNAPPPRLRRAMGSNAMTDGGFVSSSQYDMRMLFAGLNVKTASADATATQLQLLARELDRASNFLMYQAQGMTKPVFFVTSRSDFSALEAVRAQETLKLPSIDILAEPFALGLRETLGPYTVNNDPAHATNGHFFDVTGVIGDVAAECVISNTGTHRGGGYLSVRQHGTPADMAATFFVQAESMTNGTDTTNPGGGPDAAMSGTGTNNFKRTTFATAAAMEGRLTYTDSLTDAEGLALIGEYRILAVLRRSDNTSVMSVQVTAYGGGSGGVGDTIELPLATNRMVIDVGIFSFRPPVERVGRHNSAQIPVTTFELNASASRDSGSGTLDWDYFVLVPADEACLILQSSYGASTDELIVDGLGEAFYLTEGGVDPFAATSSITGSAFNASGSVPRLVPGRTNRFVYVVADLSSGEGVGSPFSITKADAATVSVNYWPAYLYVRPSAT